MSNLRNLSMVLLVLATGGCAQTKSAHLRSEVAAAAVLQASFVRSGIIDCFPKGTQIEEGKPATCEVSAVAATRDSIIFGNDRNPPAPYSPVFSLPNVEGFEAGAPVAFLEKPIVGATKYEDMTVTPDGGFVLAVTGFDRWKPEDVSEDKYNALVAWPVGRPHEAHVVNSSERNGVASSLPLRESLQQALGGVPYFKVEGLVALPGNRLLFGVRESGESYKVFDYRILILEAAYEVVDGKVSVKGAFRTLLDFKPGADLTGGRTLALSSLEYDNVRGNLLILTSFENADAPAYEGVGAFLWKMPLADLPAGQSPSLVLDVASGKPLEFVGKAEGMTILGSDRLLVVQDDDRIVGEPELRGIPGRDVHQFIYEIVKWN